MDALTGLLDGPRARGAFLLRALFSPPWAIRVEDQAALSLVVLLRGTAVFTGADGPVGLGAGDVVLARGPMPYSLAESADTPTDIRILPGQVCVDPSGHLLDKALGLGVRTWGNDVHGETAMLIGTYEHGTEVGARVLANLPADVVIRGLDSPLVALLGTEISHDAPGQVAVLDRLLDLLLVTVLRHVFATAGQHAPTWFGAQEDPVVGHAIALMHHQPAHPWSVASLADACGVSRATLSRRFTGLVGEPPITFLANWRLAVAADLLAGSDATVARVATRVGYASAFAFSVAFKRAYGVAPSAYHRTAVLRQPVA
ncbi:MAG: AraC family transcriptional regulator [Arachnia sp.]